MRMERMAAGSAEAVRVETVDIMHSRIPLPEPVSLGATRITHRDYVSIRLTFSDGSKGFASGFERGMPLFDIVRLAATHCLGKTAAMRAAVSLAGLGPVSAGRPVQVCGVSMVNIALWDGFCLQTGTPLWSLQGGSRASLPVMPVIGYGATPETVGRQCLELVDRGFSRIKIMIDCTDFAKDDALLAAVQKALPSGASFGIDAHWSWDTLADALPTCLMAEERGAVFIEDPFAPSQWQTIADLQHLSTALAVGEDVVDRHGFRQLVEAAHILRVDASVSGIDGALEAIALAQAFDRSVIPHVFPTLHAHLGFSQRAVRCIEMILPEVGADPLDRFLVHQTNIADGHIIADDRPGAGTALDWDALSQFAIRTEVMQ